MLSLIQTLSMIGTRVHLLFLIIETMEVLALTCQFIVYSYAFSDKREKLKKKDSFYHHMRMHILFSTFITYKISNSYSIFVGFP